jgi:anti-sigma regulatory factor (Ser/Thr protein kinase)
MTFTGEPVDLWFPEADLRWTAAIRRHVAREFGCLGAARIDASVVATELYVNAVLHGAAPIRVRAVPFDGGVQVRVEDRSRRFGPRRPASMGLRTVEGMARGWGIIHSAAGKTVWADVLARPEPGAPGG